MELRFLPLTGALHFGRTAECLHVSAAPDERTASATNFEKVAAAESAMTAGDPRNLLFSSLGLVGAGRWPGRNCAGLSWVRTSPSMNFAWSSAQRSKTLAAAPCSAGADPTV
ncbi:hypothetical protein [Nocardia aurantiaca]|uniref:Uncharacterized protein n=1 Tax=Nocardia aurantiaca TaxID=2675850 RepID=A0A6I3KUR4_9NOCA|nr:hypothetical protein [Nocardia aurantiaca]MTE13277.1 hypothetical protein [Nocardia aurantiaca]